MSNHEQTNATFRRMAPTEELMAYIRREGEQLRAQHSGLGLVSTTLEKLGRRRLFGARVELQMSGGRLVAKARAEDPHDALQSAFRIVERSEPRPCWKMTSGTDSTAPVGSVRVK